jgi:hypothetical protein
MPDHPDQFSAADSALGYLYQVRCALLWSLQRLKDEVEFEASIETLDDVTFEKSGTPAELLQTKLHKNRGADLSDYSTDIWRTIRIWITALNTGAITERTNLYLVTTENAAEGTIARYLRKDNRNVHGAILRLNDVAQTSSNQTNAAAYRAYRSKTDAQRKSLVEQIVVIDRAPGIADLDGLLRNEVFHAAPRIHQEAFLNYLEGWWFRRAVKQLQNVSAGDRILSEEIEAQMADLRDRFKQDSLPIADDLLNYVLDDQTDKDHQDFPFVQQVKLATSNSRRITAAIRDFYRAFEQRSRWQREDLLFVGDLSVYEKGLEEEWELVFAGVEDGLGRNATEQEKTEAALEVLSWAETGNVRTLIKENVREPFVTRGSLHILANELRIGWHPEFRDRLQNILNGGPA